MSGWVLNNSTSCARRKTQKGASFTNAGTFVWKSQARPRGCGSGLPKGEKNSKHIGFGGQGKEGGKHPLVLEGSKIPQKRIQVDERLWGNRSSHRDGE